jgi:PAS domain S-box-containing protein
VNDAGEGGVLDAVLDATNDGVVVVDADGCVRTANDALVDRLDADRKSVVGADWRTLFVGPPALDDVLDCESVDGVLGVDATERRLAVGTVEGTPVTVTGRRVDDAAVLAVTDRTAVVERDRLERILESVADGIYMLNANGRIEYVNEAALDAHGFSYDRDDVVGEFATKMMPAGGIDASIEAIQSLIADDDALSERVPVTVLDVDGREVAAELHLSLLPADDGEYAGSVGVLRDVTERRRRDQMLRVLNRVLRHNLRNDMNVVLGTTQQIAAEHGEVTAYTDRIERVAEGLVELGGKAHVVEDLTGPSANAPEPTDVTRVVEAAVDSAVGGANGGTVTVNAPSDARACIPPLFQVAVENILENALEYCDDPTVEVAVTTTDGTVRIVVSDDGPGIPSVELDALSADRETPLEHASGLGLWLTNWIVDFADGTVEYHVEDGTTVVVELPAVDADDE